MSLIETKAMFKGFNKTKFKPQTPEGFEDFSQSGSIGFANDEDNWVDEFDCLDSLQELLQQAGHNVDRQEEWLILEKALYLRPSLQAFQPTDEGSVSTVTVIAIVHPKKCPEGFYEFQHALKSNTSDAIQSGFEGWMAIDLPVILDWVNNEITQCLAMELNTEKAGLKRRALMGPHWHYAQSKIDNEEEHPFCPCCLFTNTYEAFEEQILSDRVIALRMYAARDNHGEAMADCRANGLDHVRGMDYLRDYASSWPERGYEFRKQYVIIHTIEPDS